MARFEFKESKPVTVFLALCLGIILVATYYVASMAYQQHRSGEFYRLWNVELGPVATEACRAVVAIKTIKDDAVAQVEYTNAGSGFVIDVAGYILTNEHVVHDVDQIRVTLADQRQFPAEVIGADARGDLAILKIVADGLVALDFAEPQSVEIAHPVIALGNPLGSGADGQPVTTFGSVTRLFKVLDGTIDAANDRFYDNLIQTDILILPGSSGGPLINREGQVVGVNSAMGRALETGRHFGFSIALDEHTQNRVARLKRGETIRYGFFGVETKDVDAETAKRLGLADMSGAKIKVAMLGFPGQQAGLEPGDVIVGINDVAVLSPLDLIRLMNRCGPGQPLTVFYHRGREKLSVRVTLGQRNLADLKGLVHEANQKSLEHPQWGLTLKPITDWRRNSLKMSRHQRGVLVYQVAQGSEAERLDLKAGDVLTRLANVPIGNLRDFYRVARQHESLPDVRTYGSQ